MSYQDNQLSFLDEQSAADNTPVVCLGMTFESEEARRDHFRQELRKKLPELKTIEGYPIGEDEDIIALSDPPYYTACPNPWTAEFIKQWDEEREDQNQHKNSNTEPFVSDVAEGKYDKSYKFHPYATKVPHKAIMRYILHYTKPGDIILDSFSGTGMTGVAAQLCNDKDEVESLGYKVDERGLVYSSSESKERQIKEKPFSYVGERKVILNDISSAASFISYNFNIRDSEEELNKINLSLEKVCEKTSWMYRTLHHPNTSNIQEAVQKLNNVKTYDDGTNLFNGAQSQLGEINFVSWADVFICSNCLNEVNYWDTAVEVETGKIHKEFLCPTCNTVLKKGSAERAWESYYDDNINKVVSQAKQEPVMINYTFGNKRYTKKPDLFDLELLKVIKRLNFSIWIPTNELPDGEKTNEPKRVGITNIHQFYTDRNLYVLGLLLETLETRGIGKILTRVAARINKMYGLTYQSGSWGAGGGPLSGTLYIPSLVKELNMLKQLEKSLNTQKNKLWSLSSNVVQSNGSSTKLEQIEDESIDYVFLDPPFGGNLMYSELNFIWESWLKVHTNTNEEAIVSLKHRKHLDDYKQLMTNCFKEVYRVLKSGKWITVEFSNTKASVWNVIQSAITESGFIIANVASLDKKKGSFKAITTTTAVKQDLIITAYKPSTEMIKKMKFESYTVESAWTFIQQHLKHLPVFIGKKGDASIVAERTPRILFDRMIAYHVQNGLPVPLSSAEFQAGVVQQFPMRDGMAFLESQVAEYDKKRILVKDFSQMNLFVSDENSAIEWLRQQLMKKPQTSQDLHPQFMKEIQHIAKHEQLPELNYLLQQSFLRYEGDEVVPDQIGSYLRRNFHDFRGLENSDAKMKDKALNRWYVPDPNKQADLEKLREKSLLREFASYVEELGTHKKKLKQFRTEAIRAGFKKAWSDKDYTKIVTVGDRLPEIVIQEDDKLLMYYDNAQIRLDM